MKTENIIILILAILVVVAGCAYALISITGYHIAETNDTTSENSHTLHINGSNQSGNNSENIIPGSHEDPNNVPGSG